MACIVYRTDAKGRTYAYSSESYWDKEKGQPRSKRTYLGRVNPDTGEIQKGRQQGKSSAQRLEEHLENAGDKRFENLRISLDDKDKEISELKMENKRLQEQVQKLSAICKEIAGKAASAQKVTAE